MVRIERCLLALDCTWRDNNDCILIAGSHDWKIKSMIMTTKTIPLFFNSAIMALALLLSACGSMPATPTDSTATEPTTAEPIKEPAAPFTYVDSTLLFAEETASASMRATFNREGNADMAQGYQFQFRSISPEVIFLSSISVVAGGERIFLEEGQIALPKEKGITLTLSLEESLKIAEYETALFQFKFDNESFLMAISLHKLSEYLP